VVLLSPGCSSGPIPPLQLTDYTVEIEAQKFLDDYVDRCMRRRGFEYQKEFANPTVTQVGGELSPEERVNVYGTFYVFGQFSPSPEVAKPPKEVEDPSYQSALGGFSGYASEMGVASPDPAAKPGCRQEARKKVEKQFPLLKRRAEEREEIVKAIDEAGQSAEMKQLNQEWERCMAASGFRVQYNSNWPEIILKGDVVAAKLEGTESARQGVLRADIALAKVNLQCESLVEERRAAEEAEFVQAIE
jgi:hypothetical protein